MARPCVTVREGAKNQYRQRTIPLNSAARESMEYILKRWAEIGGSSPEHYNPLSVPSPATRATGKRAHWREGPVHALPRMSPRRNGSAFRSI